MSSKTAKIICWKDHWTTVKVNSAKLLSDGLMLSTRKARKTDKPQKTKKTKTKKETVVEETAEKADELADALEEMTPITKKRRNI